MENPLTQQTTTLDKNELHRWKFPESNGFVIKDWTGIEDGGEPAIMVLKSSDIFQLIGDAAADKRKIAIYAIGNCILDWS